MTRRRLDPDRWAVALVCAGMIVAGLRQIRRFVRAYGWDLVLAVALWIVFTTGGPA